MKLKEINSLVELFFKKSEQITSEKFEKQKSFIAKKLSSSIQDPVDSLANILEEKSMWQKFGL